MVQVKSHAKPIAKVKKERAPRNLLSDIPQSLMARYLADFQPAFIHTSIAISANPWDKLSLEDAQELFNAVFPEVEHDVTPKDTFYSPVISVPLHSSLSSNDRFQADQATSIVKNHIKEASLAAVHRAMGERSPAARKHLADKAKKRGSELPFIYRHYEVTDIPSHHTEGGEVVVSFPKVSNATN